MEEEKEKQTEVATESSVETQNAASPESEEKGMQKFGKKHAIRLAITLAASSIALTFYGLSYSYFTFNISAIIFAGLVAVVAFGIVALYKDWETPYKLTVTTIYIAAVMLIGYFAMQKSGLFDKIHSSEDFVDYINNSGGVAEWVFLFVNFLQVTIVPIPSSITTTAGAILFEGIWKPLYLTVIGILVGSMFAFFLGRVFGVRFANWLVGEKTIEKYKKMTKGRDKIVLFYMFLFPFFPDDFLCILAGMTDYTYFGFFLMQVFCRTIGTLTTILLAKGILNIPLQGWWLLLWGVLIILVIVLLVFTIKYSDRIEAFIMRFIDKLTFGYTKRRRDAKENGSADAEVSLVAETEDPSEGEEYDNDEHKPDSV